MDFGGFLGNRAIKERLSGAFRQGRVSHSYLLCGKVGSGRHTLALRMAAAMQCVGGDVPCGQCKPCRKVFAGVHPDVIYVDDPDHRQISVDVIRKVCADVALKPNEGNRKIYIIHQPMTVEAQNALLKTLEEPPAYAVFLLLMESEEQVLATIRSRCPILQLAPLSKGELIDALRTAFPGTSEQALSEAWEASGGYLGAALELLKSEPIPAEARKIAESYAAKDFMGLLVTLVPLEKYKRETLISVLNSLIALLTGALTAQNRADAGTLLQTRTPAQVFAAICDIRHAADDLNANVGVGAVVGWLATRLR